MVGSEEGGDMPTPSTKISPGWPSYRCGPSTATPVCSHAGV
jgi:hypothetical protein